MGFLCVCVRVFVFVCSCVCVLVCNMALVIGSPHYNTRTEFSKSLLVDEALLHMGPCRKQAMYLAVRRAFASPAACSCCRLFLLDLLHMSEHPCMFAVLRVQVLTLELPRWSANKRGSFLPSLSSFAPPSRRNGGLWVLIVPNPSTLLLSSTCKACEGGLCS